MSYSISISGSAPDAATETEIADALNAAINNPDFGVTSAQGFFQFNGTVDLLPSAPPVDDPKQDLDASVTALDDLLAAKLTADASGDPITVSAADAESIFTAMADVQTDVEAYETSVSALVAGPGNSASSSTDSSTTPVSSSTGPSTSPTGTGTADAPTLSTGEAVSL